MPVAVDLARPEWLLVLPVLAAGLVIARLPWWRAALARRGSSKAASGDGSASNPLPYLRSRALRAEARRLGLRLLWLALPLLALAGLALIRPLDRLAVVFVFDRSESVAPVRDHQAAAVAAALTELDDRDVAGVVGTGAAARVEQPLASNLLPDRVVGSAAPASNLAAGIALAGGLVPADRTGRVVLLSDGRETTGDGIAAARELAARGVTLDVLPFGPTTALADVRLDRVVAPETVREGEASVVRAGVSAGRPTNGTLRVYRNDELVVEQAVQLRAGEQEFALAVGPAGQTGMRRLRVEVAADDAAADATPLNNALGAAQRVLGTPRVLLVASDASAAGFLPAALGAGGVQPRVVAPPALPGDLAGFAAYDAVVLVDVAAHALPAGAQALLERYVRELGRGLVMTGGPDAFGPGGYADTPIEEALPVYMDVRGRGREPRVALMLVIDRSGSMQGLKMEMAKEAAVRSVRLLNAEDQAGVVVFDTYPQWVARLGSVDDGEWLEHAVGSVYAGGGTEIFPAVTAGFEALRQAEADVKHMIVLTDGHSASGGDYVALLDRLREERITLSSVAVGGDADQALLEALARSGRGRSHVAADPALLPEIFTEETVMATRTIFVDGTFFPAAASVGPLLRGVDRAPALHGYVAVTAKERAEVVLLSHEGDPILAAWQYGAGRAVAWTADVGGRWSRAWADHAAAPVLWGNVFSWLLPPPEEGELTARVEQEPGGFALIVENRAAWDEVRATRATLIGTAEEQVELTLEPDGPGRYRAPLPAMDVGAYVIRAHQVLTTDEGGPGGELRTETGWSAPYPAEYRAVGIDTSTLARIAEAGGGRVLDDPVAAARPPDRPAAARSPLAPLLLVLAAIAWPLEIASRRLPMPALPPWLRRRNLTPADARVRPTATAQPHSGPEEPPKNEAPPSPTGRLLQHARARRRQRLR